MDLTRIQQRMDAGMPISDGMVRAAARKLERVGMVDEAQQLRDAVDGGTLAEVLPDVIQQVADATAL
jgi:hypothetical protein